MFGWSVHFEPSLTDCSDPETPRELLAMLPRVFSVMVTQRKSGFESRNIKQAVTNCTTRNAPPFPPHHRPSPVCTSAEVFSHRRARRCSAVAVRRQAPARPAHPTLPMHNSESVRPHISPFLLDSYGGRLAFVVFLCRAMIPED
jgi:hypothetical protein